MIADEIETDDDGNCIYCGQTCWDGDMCDEQQAGGFNDEDVEEQQRRDEKNGLYPDRWDDCN